MCGRHDRRGSLCRASEHTVVGEENGSAGVDCKLKLLVLLRLCQCLGLNGIYVHKHILMIRRMSIDSSGCSMLLSIESS